MSAGIGTHLESLEQVLRQLLAGHQALLVCVQAKRQALRTADLATLETTGQREMAITRRLAGLEQKRKTLAGLIATAVDAPEAAGSITALAEAVDEPHRAALLALGVELRDLVTEARRETSVVRQAAEALAQHMNGVMESVRATFSRAGVYGREGRLAAGADQVDSCVDLRS